MNLSAIELIAPITKQTIKDFKRCKKYVWHKFNTPELILEDEKNFFIPDYLLELFDLTNYIKQIHGIGYETENKENLELLTQETLNAAKTQTIIYNPAVSFNGLYAKANLIKRSRNSKFDLICSGKSVKVKRRYINDMAFTKFVFESAGILIKHAYVYTINKRFIKNGKINADELLVKNNITERVNEIYNKIKRQIDEILTLINQKEPPEISFAAKCLSYNICQLKDKCWEKLPDRNVFLLTGSDRWDIGNELINKNLYDLKDIPEDFPLNEKQKIQFDCELSGREHVDKTKISEFISTLKYPLYFLDFEATANMIIPVYDNTSSFQQIPYQFSLHIMENNKSKEKHYYFINPDQNDPRKRFIDKLIELLGDTGSIVVYNSSFESRILSQTVNSCGISKSWLNNIIKRFFDLSIPFENYYYYHPNQNGKVSLKTILPILTGHSYSNLNIGEALDAANEYMRVVFTQVSERDKIQTFNNLIEYGKLDTLGLIKILYKLKGMID